MNIVKLQNLLTGVFAWNSYGFTGKNICIWNMESGTDHSEGTTQRIYDAAPGIKVICADLRLNEKHDQVISSYVYDPQPIFWIKPPHQQQSSMVLTHAPITLQTHMLPTIADILGFTNFDYGDTVFDVKDEPVERWTKIYEYNSDYPASVSSGQQNVVYEYHYTGDRDDLIEAFRGDDMIIYPMTKNLEFMLVEYWNNEQE